MRGRGGHRDVAGGHRCDGGGGGVGRCSGVGVGVGGVGVGVASRGRGRSPTPTAGLSPEHTDRVVQVLLPEAPSLTAYGLRQCIEEWTSRTGTTHPRPPRPVVQHLPDPDPVPEDQHSRWRPVEYAADSQPLWTDDPYPPTTGPDPPHHPPRTTTNHRSEPAPAPASPSPRHERGLCGHDVVGCTGHPVAPVSAACIAARGAGRPVNCSTCPNAWCSSMSNPVATRRPRAPAAATSGVGHGW